MVITRQDETELLTTIHEGVFETPLWSTFLGRLRRRVRADEVRILIGRPGTPGLRVREFAATQTLFGSADLHRLQNSYDLEPAPFQRLRPNRVYSTEELPPLTRDGRDEYRRLVRVAESGGLNGWLHIARSSAAFGAGDGALLAALAPHLGIALHALAAILRAQLQDSAASRALDHLHIGWIALDSHGHVVDGSEEADRLLRQHGLSMRSRDVQSRPVLPGTADVIAQLVAGAPAPRAVRIAADPPTDLMISLLDDRLATIASGAVAIAFIRSPPLTAQPPDPAALMILFGFTSAEARLASLMVGGATIAEAAPMLGLTLETTRNYSKRVYARAGVSGQSALLRSIFSSGAILA